MFATQDPYARQTRMPEPPLLLADRVTGLDAEPQSMGKGVIWTETDVKEDSWFLHEGYMPGGIMIEAGQADLMLISYLGIDLLNRGDRVYRLLGCTLSYEGDLPSVGETLQYEIHVDGHARFDDVRLFFFHYDCCVDGQLRLRVRDAQAGFFTDEELAATTGVLWDPEQADINADARVDLPAAACEASTFGPRELHAFADGQTFECFGNGFEAARSHVRSPRIQRGHHLLVDEVTEFDPTGGPWGRGYLRAEKRVTADDWYFKGHFKNDPCMPGSLMCDATNQVMAFYLAAVGFTLDHDGWRFQPVTGHPFELKCRGQVTPASERVVYEIFVHELIRDPDPHRSTPTSSARPTASRRSTGTGSGCSSCRTGRSAVAPSCWRATPSRSRSPLVEAASKWDMTHCSGRHGAALPRRSVSGSPNSTGPGGSLAFRALPITSCPGSSGSTPTGCYGPERASRSSTNSPRTLGSSRMWAGRVLPTRCSSRLGSNRAAGCRASARC